MLHALLDTRIYCSSENKAEDAREDRGIYFGGLLLQHLLRPLRCLPAKAGARLHVGQGQIIVIEERYAVIKSFS